MCVVARQLGHLWSAKRRHAQTRTQRHAIQHELTFTENTQQQKAFEAGDIVFGTACNCRNNRMYVSLCKCFGSFLQTMSVYVCVHAVEAIKRYIIVGFGFRNYVKVVC